MFTLVNLDRRETIDPFFFGDGSKMLEFTTESVGTLTGLSVLLTNSGFSHQIDKDNPLAAEYIGRWQGQRIVFAGDYDENIDSQYGESLYYASGNPRNEFKDISIPVFKILLMIDYVRNGLERKSYYSGKQDKFVPLAKWLEEIEAENAEVKLPWSLK